MSKVILIFAAVTLSFVGVSRAEACGESLYRFGKGSPNTSFRVPLPGRILVVGASESDDRLAAMLSASGHDVTRVESVEAVADTLARDPDFDLVLSMYEQHAAVTAQLAQSSVVYLPVAAADSEAERHGARQLNEFAPAADDRIKQILRSVHRAIRRARA